MRLTRRGRVVVVAMIGGLCFGAGASSRAWADSKVEAEGSGCSGSTTGTSATNFSGGGWRGDGNTSATTRVVCTATMPAHSKLEVRTFESINSGSYSYEIDGGGAQTHTVVASAYTTWTLIADSGAKPTSHTFSLWRTTAAIGPFPVLDYYQVTTPECDTNLGRTPAPGGGCAMVLAGPLAVTVPTPLPVSLTTPVPVTVANASPIPVTGTGSTLSGCTDLAPCAATLQGVEPNLLGTWAVAAGFCLLFLAIGAVAVIRR